MATASTTASDSLVVESWQSPAENQTNSDRYLARRLEAAGADYKGVALTTFILGALVGTIAWAACGILVEHWLVSGGLPRVVRWGWLAAGLVALVAAAVRWLLPLVRYKVNLVYAAHAIERSNPDLHNDLVNTVLVKARPEGSAAVVVRSLEKRAAKRLADVPADAVIDRTQAVRLAYLLAVLVGAACLYELLAPKSLLVSAARLVAPWAGIAAPSRVWIESPRLHWRMPGGAPVDDGFNEAQRMEVDRGTATLVRGRQLVLSSGIRGLARGEKPVVHVVPLADGGSVDASAAPWTVEMTRGAAEADSGKAFTAMLPDASRGLENSVLISIAAGDSRSEPVRVVVIDSPSLLVREVRYDYPAYTARATETFEWQGDLRALEETQVTLIAECNQPLESAWIDFDCDGHRDLKLKVGTSDLARASVTFPLRLSADRSGPEHASYRLVFQPRDGLQGGREVVITEPLEHRIEVAADLAPEVSIESPTESPLTVPPAAPVTVRVRALDPDFALVKVAIETRVNGGRAAAPIVIFEGTKKGPFKGAGRLTPFSLGAGPGSVLEYRAVAFDNRGHEANQGSSPWQELRIDAAAPPRADEQPEEQPEEQRPGDNGRQGERRDQGAGDEPGDNGPAGDDPSDAAGNEEGGAGEQPPGNKSDPQQRDRQRKQQPNGEGDADAPQQQPGDEGAAGQGANPNGQQQGNGTKQQPGAGGEKQEGQEGSQPGNKQGAGRGTPGKQGPGEGNDSTAGKEPQEGSEEGEGAQSAGKEPGGKQGSGKQPAAGRSRAVGPDGRQPPNDSVAADGTNDGEAMDRILEHRRREDGELPQGTDGKKQGEGQKGEGQKGEGQKGEGQKGEGQKGEGQKGEGQQGEGQQGEGQKGEGDRDPGGKQAGGKRKGGQPPEQGPQPNAGGSETGGNQTGDKEGAGGQDPEKPATGQPGTSSSPTGSGGWSGGEGPPPEGGASEGENSPLKEAEWEEQDVDHARNAADLAIRTLKEDLDAGRSGILDELGWTRDQARAFLKRWEAMQAMARSDDPVKRGDVERAVRSLGLRPDGARGSRDVPSDVKGGQAEGRRTRPPSEYREQFKAYTQGTTGE